MKFARLLPASILLLGQLAAPAMARDVTHAMGVTDAPANAVLDDIEAI